MIQNFKSYTYINKDLLLFEKKNIFFGRATLLFKYYIIIEYYKSIHFLSKKNLSLKHLFLLKNRCFFMPIFLTEKVCFLVQNDADNF